jgi:cysteine desulfurase
MIYLDYAAATPLDRRVLTAMQPFLTDRFYNPSSAYTVARETRADYEAARHDIAKVLGAAPVEIVLTAGATESINLALRSFRNILVGAIEHPAVLACADGQTVVKVDKTGRLDLADLKRKITDETELISVGYANSEIGVVQPLKEIATLVATVRAQRLARGLKRPLYLHTDASAAAGFLDLNVARLGVDLLTLNAAKCYGPKQVGCLYVRSGVRLQPSVLGGGQENGLRSGTENVAGVVGFATALRLAEKKRHGEVARLKKMRDQLEGFVLSEFAGLGAVVNGGRKQRLPNILNFSIPGLDGERAVFALDFAGICVATGSACAANKGTRSHVLTALGLSEKTIDGSLRISLGRDTTEADIKITQKKLSKILPQELAISQRS